jgi:hypothetical protein
MLNKLGASSTLSLDTQSLTLCSLSQGMQPMELELLMALITTVAVQVKDLYALNASKLSYQLTQLPVFSS